VTWTFRIAFPSWKNEGVKSDLSTPKKHFPWQISYLTAGLVWGCSFWFIKVGLEMLSPIQVAFGRVVIGASALLLVCAITRTALPRERSMWKHLFVMALLLNSVPFTLFAYGETHISSVLAGIINAVTPLFAFLAFFVVMPTERASRDRIAGLLIGFAGVVVVLGVWNGLGSGEWSGVIACLVAVAGYGISFPYARRHLMNTSVSPLAICTGQLGLGTLQLLPFVLISGGVSGDVTAGPVFAMLALGALGSGLAYVANFHVITSVGGTVASTVTYLTPVVAVVVGIAFLHESLAWYEPVGALIVLLGAAMTQGRVRFPIAKRAQLAQ
jgi:drug/metabolite transporter (DMT)-like permease